MTTKIRMWVAGITVMALFVLVFVSGPSYGQNQNAPLKADVLKIAALIKKGDDDGARKLATLTAKKGIKIEDVMHQFKPRKPRTKEGIPGLGWGPNALPPAFAAKDGLELMVRDLAKAVPVGFDPAAEEASYWIAALADVAKAKGGPGGAKRNKRTWDYFNDEMRDAAITLAKASAAKDNVQVKDAAGKLNKVCINCHFQFK